MKITVEELRKELNTICLLEFQENYNKSEAARILSTNGESNKRGKALEKRLNEELQEGTVISVSNCGTLILLKQVKKDENLTIFDNSKIVFAEILDKLPYGYVMGSKVGKRVMEDIVNRLKGETNLK